MEHERRFRLAAVGVAAACAGLLAWLLSGAGSAQTREVVSDLGYLAGSLAAAVSCGLAARRQRPPLRRPWLLLCGTGCSWTVGNVFWFYRRALLGDLSFPAPQDAFYALALVLAVASLVSFLAVALRRASPVRLLLEALTIALSLVFLSWALVLEDVFRSAGVDGLGRTVLLLYPAGDIALASLALFLAARSRPEARRQFGLVAAGFLSYALADSLYAYLGVIGRFAMGTLVDLPWIAGYLLIALAGMAARGGDAAAEEVAEDRDDRSVVRELLLYLPTLAALGYATVSDLQGDVLLIGTGLAILVLIGVRHALMIAEALALTRNLQSTVALRTSELRSILDSAAEGIYGLDLTGRTTFINPTAAHLTGHAAEELLGRRQHDIVHRLRPDGTPYPYEDCPVTASLRDGLVSDVSDEVYWRKDGTSFPVEYTSTPLVQDGEITGAVVTFRDVSDRRAAERAKDEFTSVVSHELRTPLTSIRGSLGLLAGGVLGALPEQAQRMLDIAVSNTDRLVRLINDILDIERMESGKASLSREQCDAADLVAQAVQVVQALADDAGVEIVTRPVEARLWADPDRIVQTLTNLLSNAVKFSPPGGTVSLVVARQNEDVLFTVADQGRGIPADKLEAIFGRFQQVDASDSRDKGGSGLGLAISRSIVAQHGGRIWVDSVIGEGSTFSFTIPGLLEQLSPADVVPGAPLILVCDDDHSVLEVVGAMLRRRGFDVVTADSGEQAVRSARDRRPDVVLLDLIMPGMGGWETVSALKADPQTQGIPVVILSVLSAGETEQPAVAVADWVDKPIDDGLLFDALERALHGGTGARRVLLVEDDVDLAQVISATFERRGLETFHARNGREALRLSQRLVPDLLVLDGGLPDHDGFRVVEWLRAQERLDRIPLLVYTARDLDEHDRRRLRLGETTFLTKGRISPEDFDAQVTRLLDRLTRAPAEVASP